MCDDRTLLLIVEDDDLTRDVLARLMAREGWTTLTAATVAEGIDHLGAGPDCVILDLDLPDGRGESVLRAIHERGMPIRVVVCTAAADAARLDDVGRLGAHALLHKPVDVDAMLEACGDAGQAPS